MPAVSPRGTSNAASVGSLSGAIGVPTLRGVTSRASVPVTYVSRDLEGLVDVAVGEPEFETEKEPLSVTLRAERNRRNAAPRRGPPNRLRLGFGYASWRAVPEPDQATPNRS